MKTTINRMKLFKIITGLLLLMATPGGVKAQQLSSIPGAFVDVGIGASIAAYGYAGTASSRGATALNWNPAGIYPEEGPEATFSFVDQLEIVEYGYFSLSVPLWENRNAFALSAQVSGDESLLEESVSVGYAHRFGFVWMGVSGSYRRAVYGKNALRADDYVIFTPDEVTAGLDRQVSGTASGFGLDAGIQLLLTDGVVFGVTARNMAAPIAWSSWSAARPGTKEYSESIPLEVAMGIQYRLSDKLAGSIEWVPEIKAGSISRIGIGAAFNPVTILAIRAGRLILQDGFDNDINTFGFGLKTPPSMDLRLRADYAFITGNIARTQQVSLVIGL
ncbi:MAG: hypothetical protein HOC28_08900 [Bacteroidetes Order II. Incertae sedis bacterium]|nr:hypothetical protein [Bacteroidetes Order II. bacterium]MBT4603244.1 hypothetical protein [Bacteroidetes Order II. bacterium]MBT5250682.1 hypothetical protein [Bacteroidetes Order II. bacterium]MBT6201990.1 hypothetical protein [Bacteroidetes Order II. bacterium]MBT6425775.1 hypothetical protein [Bacteroidetes Order II. bacterium]